MRRLGRNPLARWCLAASLAVLGAVWSEGAQADPKPRPIDDMFSKITVIDFEGEIEQALGAYLLRRIDQAKDDGAECIVFRIHSPGGRVDTSREVASAILNLPDHIHTIAWVEEFAFSGASMAALACDEIVMAPGAKVGDCQPIFNSPEGIIPAGEKMETVLRADFRRFAEKNGWDPLLAEKMVSKDAQVVVVRDAKGEFHFVDGADLASARQGDLVAGIPKKELVRVRVAVPDGRLLTLNTVEARDFGFVHRVFDKESDLVAAISAPGAVVTQVHMTLSERSSRWLLNVVGVLGALVGLCLMLTLFQGIGIATLVGVIALALSAILTVTAGLSFGFPLALVVIGILLLAVEAFLLPGFGVAGILGIVFTAAGFLSLGTGFTLSSSGSLDGDTLARFALQFAGTVVVAGAFFLFLSRIVPSLPFARRHLILPAGSLGAGAAVLSTDVYPTVGAVGKAETDLRPAGRALLLERSYDVTSEGGFVETGTPVKVVRVEGARVVVRAEPAS